MIVRFTIWTESGDTLTDEVVLDEKAMVLVRASDLAMAKTLMKALKNKASSFLHQVYRSRG